MLLYRTFPFICNPKGIPRRSRQPYYGIYYPVWGISSTAHDTACLLSRDTGTTRVRSAIHYYATSIRDSLYQTQAGNLYTNSTTPMHMKPQTAADRHKHRYTDVVVKSQVAFDLFSLKFTRKSTKSDYHLLRVSAIFSTNPCGMLILYAEDDVDDYGFFEETLTRVYPGAKCINARNGREVLEILDASTILPDLIFLDINMPTMDGKSCLKSIKNDPQLKSIPVIIYTTSSNEKDREQCLQLGAEKYLIKPFGLMAAEPLIRDALQPFIEQNKR